MKKCILILAVAALILSSCSPKIIGATPHRRDRHCGCENLQKPAPADSTFAASNYCMIDK